MAGKGHQAAYARLEAYGLDRILDRVIDGELLRPMAEEFGMSRPVLSSYLTGRFCGSDPAEIEKGQKRRQLYMEARRMSAQSIVEDGVEILDNERDPRAAQIATARATFRLKLAEVYDRERFGQKAQKIEIDIAVTHLDALRKRTILRVTSDAPHELGSGEPDIEVLPSEASELQQLIGN